MTYEKQLSIVNDLQDRMRPLQHKLENSRLTHASRVSIECALCELKVKWFDAMADLHAMPEYKGEYAFQKENNPYR